MDSDAAIRLANPEDRLDHLVAAAFARATTVRGGRSLLEQIWPGEPDVDRTRGAIARAVDDRRVWIACSGEEIIGGALVGEGCVQAIWVEHSHRRHGVATALLQELLAVDRPPQDAWALPGDRATKSLYESVGWKARLLTMRGA